MELPLLLQLLAFVVLFLLSGTFSGSETALFSLSHAKLRRWQTSGTRAEQRVAALMGDHHGTLVAILLGNNLVNVLAAVLFGRLFTQHVLPDGQGGSFVAAVVMTGLLLVFGEVTPKTIALIHADRLAPLIGGPMAAFVRFSKPLASIPDWLSRKVLGVLGGAPGPVALSVEEYQTYVQMGEALGVFSPSESATLDEVFRLREMHVGSIMVPRTDVATIDAGCSAAEVEAAVRRHRHRYLPVVDGTLDEPHGALVVRPFMQAEPADRERWRETFVQRPLYLPAGTSLSLALRRFREEGHRFCFVVDEYGGVAGVLTLEDIVEELVGDLRDEFAQPQWHLATLQPGRWRVSGPMPLHQLQKSLPEPLPESNADTAGGLLAELAGHLPADGERERAGRWEFVTRRVQRNRVLELDLILHDQAEEDAP